jgi:hypothetical protein
MWDFVRKANNGGNEERKEENQRVEREIQRHMNPMLLEK